MKVIKAEKAGFCFGVKRAVDMALEVASKDKEIYSYGQLIHNDQVTQKLAEKGILLIESIEPITSGDVIVRSHGVGKSFYDACEDKNLNVINCTCPFVEKVHRIVDSYYKKGYGIIIIGDKNHPEVIGINGWCNNSALILNDIDEILQLEDKPYCVVAQTTLKYALWEAITHKLSGMGAMTVFNTICSATSERQEAAMVLAKKVDCMIVIGGYHSSNTRKLYEICKELCENTIHIEKKSDLVMTNMNKCGIIGITAGASTPDWIIDEVYDFLVQQ
ncbi:MAG: 4-hydroxy-3-methylbut-2-enyl diphosphate reductase [Clostridia bacterium]|nr:4-hydroxy-3-methylbut-2-enyl diphosphate reductase [Clostridia bacterium]